MFLNVIGLKTLATAGLFQTEAEMQSPGAFSGVADFGLGSSFKSMLLGEQMDIA